MKRITLIAALIIVFSGFSAAHQDHNDGAKPGWKPGDIFYPVEQFVEEIEVRVAGFMGGPDLKAKAIANNADERVAEARKLASKNRTDEIPGLIRKYRNKMEKAANMSRSTGNSEVTNRIGEANSRNKLRIEEMKKKMPEKARNSIEDSTNRGEGSEKSSKNIPGKTNPGKTGTGDRTPGPEIRNREGNPATGSFAGSGRGR